MKDSVRLPQTLLPQEALSESTSVFRTDLELEESDASNEDVEVCCEECQVECRG